MFSKFPLMQKKNLVVGQVLPFMILNDDLNYGEFVGFRLTGMSPRMKYSLKLMAL